MYRYLAFAAVLASAGCHAKFKKHAPTLGSVNTQVLITGGPYVELGKVSGVSIAGRITVGSPRS